jgi:hypothetical protein
MADAEYARFETMTNVELRTELKRRNCSTTGNKKDLLAKLRAALQKQYEQQTSVGYTLNETPVNTIHDQVNDALKRERETWKMYGFCFFLYRSLIR